MLNSDYIIFQNNTARIAGSEHLKAELVARMHINGERSFDFVMTHYGLSRAQVHASLAYYYENQEALGIAYEQDWAESHSIKADEFRAEIEARIAKMKDSQE